MGDEIEILSVSPPIETGVNLSYATHHEGSCAYQVQQVPRQCPNQEPSGSGSFFRNLKS